jgi:hypothetical protein
MPPLSSTCVNRGEQSENVGASRIFCSEIVRSRYRIRRTRSKADQYPPGKEEENNSSSRFSGSSCIWEGIPLTSRERNIATATHVRVDSNLSDEESFTLCRAPVGVIPGDRNKRAHQERIESFFPNQGLGSFVKCVQAQNRSNLWRISSELLDICGR